MAGQPLELSRDQILGHRRRVAGLDQRLPHSPDSLERAAFAGFTDSMPRAAQLSIHARVSGTKPSTWSEPLLVQIWGPRFSAYVVAERDVPVFTLGRHPDPGPALRRAEETANLLDGFLAGRRMSYAEAGHGMGMDPNTLRYATTTGRVQIHWDGARKPTVWMRPAPQMDPMEARLQLARRYLTTFGPGTAVGFSGWAGIRLPRATATLQRLGAETLRTRSPIGEGWILASDEASFRAPPSPASGVRLLPSGDTWFFLHGAQRALLLPDVEHRSRLWTSRVWPGAILVDGEVVGTWRRSNAVIDLSPWRPLSAHDIGRVEAEAAGLPLPGFVGRIEIRWEP